MSDAVPQMVAMVKGRWRGRARGGMLVSVRGGVREPGGSGASRGEKEQYWRRAGE